MRLEGRTALVTGGSRGIGRHCAMPASEGADVAVNYVSRPEPAERSPPRSASSAARRSPCRRRQQLRIGVGDVRKVVEAWATSTSWSTRRDHVG